MRSPNSAMSTLQKSKVAGQRFFRENTKWEAIDDSYNLNRVTEVALSFARGDEVPHIFTRKPRLQPAEFLITSAKRLLQHNLPGANIEYQAFWVSNQAPPATKAIPASRGTSLPNGVTFSTNTNAERAAIQKRFMTPATNNSAITAQQQPMQ